MAARNLIITYDLRQPGKDYTSLFNAIKSLGKAVRYQLSAWYVSSEQGVVQARDYLQRFMDSNDSIFVADANTNEAAWNNLIPGASDFILSNWNQNASGYRRAS
ncbi:MAG: hypothetical protein A3E78_00270 [Alphaproteobacteria bacterium RIFCSPHIGHO2_12_FULL_63_12]|nr:MAG: hypothetical protein A3E78_00270 [Alphaproteobacteria bacterium RIFCSPHIGHO2_12_FULL_63_12]